jgi:predicted nucleotidyltransferase
MKSIVTLLNDMQKKKIIKRWALGGGIAAKYYVNPPATRDVDFFVIVDDKSIMFMQPIYAYMVHHGAKFVGHLFKYKNMIVDIIPAMNDLVKESVMNSITVDMDGVKVKIVDPNYLAAIALQVGRKKDIDRVIRLLNSGKLTQYFEVLREKYNLPIQKLRKCG